MKWEIDFPECEVRIWIFVCEACSGKRSPEREALN